ncbi:MAG: Rpn family recombination-promoting nuclease/putative transposase, partial [Planctomycetes bacterium]|nr:Rpn family recombination-promoting nuclease/putative transposase [Planctomycetota bacterium]
EIARFDPAERAAYEESIKVYRDLKNVIDTGREEGRELGREEGLALGRELGREEGRKEGREEGRKQGDLDRTVEVARRMKAAGESEAKIAAYTGLTPEQVRTL